MSPVSVLIVDQHCALLHAIKTVHTQKLRTVFLGGCTVHLQKDRGQGKSFLKTPLPARFTCALPLTISYASVASEYAASASRRIEIRKLPVSDKIKYY